MKLLRFIKNLSTSFGKLLANVIQFIFCVSIPILVLHGIVCSVGAIAILLGYPTPAGFDGNINLAAGWCIMILSGIFTLLIVGAAHVITWIKEIWKES